jgi:signal transduction histidine kinase
MTRILIVEDSPTQAAQLQFILDAEDIAADIAADAERGMAMYESGQYDMVISDIMMPGMSGYDLCHRIKHHEGGRDTPVILLSTLSDPMDIIRGLECEADNFITKPYEADQLVARVRTVLANRAMRSSGKLTFGVEIVFLGKKFLINSEKEQILDLLIATFEDIVRTNLGLQASKAQLAAAKLELETYAHELERRVQERTAELVAQQEQLHQAQKMEAVGQLTGGLAHDFNNLLMIIIANLDLLETMLKGQPAAQKLVNAAVGASLRGAELTKQLLAFSRRQQLQPQPVDLNRLVSATAELLRRTLGEAIAIRTAFGRQIWTADADPSQVESALVNLSINARDAMPGGGALTIETANVTLDDVYVADNPDATAGDYVMLAVTDTGTGMPPDVVRRVFEPFFTTKPVGQGTGLGLSMVYGFAKQSGGHVKIYSEPGHGTTVRLYLPKAKAQHAAEPIADPGAGGSLQGNDEVVLVVEDNEDVRSVTARQLGILGYRVIEAETAPEAMRVIDGDARVDVMFTDVVMPGGVSGFDLAEHARARRPDLGILFTSGFTEVSLRNNAALEQSAGLLSKPYRLEALARKIREALTLRARS